jgi:hypothetical protein
MNWPIWRMVEKIILDTGVKPILAVVPDNQDETLKVGEDNKNFWYEVRLWQARGWTIGLHGYQHLWTTQDSGLLGVNPFSEFSGLSFVEQQRKLEQALDIFRRQHVTADIWVAPGHSFDETTLKVLNGLGILNVSDGYFLYSHVDSRGMTWIPQQLWRFRRMPLGIWTVCFHINGWTREDVDRFRWHLDDFREAVTDVPSVLARAQKKQRSRIDTLFNSAYRFVIRGRRWLGERRGETLVLC